MSEFKSKPEPGGKTNGMLNRTPDINCPLCQLWGIPWDDDDPDTWGKQHINAERVWREWNPKDKQGKWVQNVIRVCAEMDPPIDIDEKTVKDHFGRKHRIEQPMLSERINHEDAFFETNELPEEAKRIIEAVFRIKCLTTNQITEIFFKPSKPVGKTAQNTAARVLNTLASSWNLYRYMPSQSDSERKNAVSNMNKTAVWFLGKMSVPYIQEKYHIDQRFYPHYLNRARSADTNNLAHDLRAGDVFASFYRELNNLEPGEDSPDGRKVFSEIAGNIEVWAMTDNWYGPGMNLLPLGYVDPQSGETRRMLPDGFATVSVVGSDKGMPDTLLPFFIEYDNDSKTVGEVADQLLSYHFMGITGASKKRFPELDVVNYIPPTLMVFSRKNRVKVVAKKLREKAKEMGLDSGAPLLLVAEEDWSKGPFSVKEVISAWDEDGDSLMFLDLLIKSSHQLIKSGSVDPYMKLKLDPTAAPARSEKKSSKEDKGEYFNNLDFEPKRDSERAKEFIENKGLKQEEPKNKPEISWDNEKEIAKQNEEEKISSTKDNSSALNDIKPASVSGQESWSLLNKDQDGISNEDLDQETDPQQSNLEVSFGDSQIKPKEEVSLEEKDLNNPALDNDTKQEEENPESIKINEPGLAEEKNNLSWVKEKPNETEITESRPSDNKDNESLILDQPEKEEIEPLPVQDINNKDKARPSNSKLNNNENSAEDSPIDIEIAIKTFASGPELKNLEPDLPELVDEPVIDQSPDDLPIKETEEIVDIPQSDPNKGPIVSKHDLPNISSVGVEDESPEYEKNKFLDLTGSSANFPTLESNVTGLNPTPTPIDPPRETISSPNNMSSFSQQDPLAPNNLVNFPDAPIYKPELNQITVPDDNNMDLSSLPQDSPIRKQAESELAKPEVKQPFVAGQATNPISDTIEEVKPKPVKEPTFQTPYPERSQNEKIIPAEPEVITGFPEKQTINRLNSEKDIPNNVSTPSSNQTSNENEEFNKKMLTQAERRKARRRRRSNDPEDNL